MPYGTIEASPGIIEQIPKYLVWSTTSPSWRYEVVYSDLLNDVAYIQGDTPYKVNVRMDIQSNCAPNCENYPVSFDLEIRDPCEISFLRDDLWEGPASMQIKVYDANPTTAYVRMFDDVSIQMDPHHFPTASPQGYNYCGP